MIGPYQTKDPDGELPYWFDWSDFCDDEGSDVASYALAVDDGPDGALTLMNDARSGNVISFLPLGGTVEETYTIRCRVVLVNGEKEDHSRTLTIEQH